MNTIMTTNPAIAPAFDHVWATLAFAADAVRVEAAAAVRIRASHDATDATDGIGAVKATLPGTTAWSPPTC